MPRFDLNNSADFARATSSFGGSILSNFTGSGPSAWVIEEGAYKSEINPDNIVVFHVFRSSKPYQGALSQIADKGGRRKAKFQFPYVDGQLTEDMGRNAETFDLDIVLHGNNYLTAFNQLMTILNEPVPGTLIHPVRGEVRCCMETYEITHKSDSRKAVAIRLTMAEHSIDALALRNREDKTASSLIQKLTKSFAKIERVINAVQAVNFLVQSIKQNIVQGLSAYKAAYAKIAGNMNATFNPGSNVPALLPVQHGGLLDSNGNIVSDGTTIAASPSDPFQNLPLDLTSTVLQTALAIEQIQKDIAASRAQAAALLQQLEESGNGIGSLEFHDNILELRETVNDQQDAFEAGKQSSQVSIIQFTTPRVMSVREVAFALGLAPDDGIQIAYLNPELDSLNMIDQGTILRVAVT